MPVVRAATRACSRPVSVTATSRPRARIPDRWKWRTKRRPERACRKNDGGGRNAALFVGEGLRARRSQAPGLKQNVTDDRLKLMKTVSLVVAGAAAIAALAFMGLPGASAPPPPKP